jgi:hypothetical protein
MSPEEFYNLFKLCIFSYLASLLITITVILIKYQNLALIFKNSNYLVCQENSNFFILETF